MAWVKEVEDCAFELSVGPEINPHEAHNNSNRPKVVDIEVHFENGYLNLGMLRRVVRVLG